MRLFLAVTFVLFARIAEACSCAPPPPPKAALKHAGAVFAGKVKEIRVVRPDGTKFVASAKEDWQKLGFSHRTEVVFDVTKAWKGVKTGELVFDNPVPICCICIIQFHAGEEYLVYADKNKDGSLGTSSCSRTVETKHAQAAL